jgi:hypothetical protein
MSARRRKSTNERVRDYSAIFVEPALGALLVGERAHGLAARSRKGEIR